MIQYELAITNYYAMPYPPKKMESVADKCKKFLKEFVNHINSLSN